MIELDKQPFNLDKEQIKWVNSTLLSLSLKQKVGQLFFPVGLDFDKKYLKELIEKYQPSGMMFRPENKKTIKETHDYLQSISPIPMLISANLENGANGSSLDATEFATQMQLAATNNRNHLKNFIEVSSKEAKILGCNWTFSPVVDIDFNKHNPITNVRTFGSDPQKVKQLSELYVRECNKNGLATAVKHFPGDGIDFRDQHIALTSNTLSTEKWDATYGAIYKAVIDAGTLAVMCGHIKLPAYSKLLNPQLTDATLLPASLAPELLQGLLRDRLGFNGLIVSDATAMLGFTAAMPRRQAVPKAIAAGCDIFLFNKDLSEDFQFMLDGIEQGLLSTERLDEAVTRILATKAALNLHIAKSPLDDAELAQVGCDAHQQLAAQCADDTVTLVKNDAQILPLNPAQHKRVLLFLLSDEGDFFGDKNSMFEYAISALEHEGFTVTVFDNQKFTARDIAMSVSEFSQQYDLVLYLANIKPASNKTSLRIHWAKPMGINAPWFSAELPCVFVSFGNPYHLVDVSEVPVYINAYTGTNATVDAVIAKLLGRSEFKGISPVDALTIN